MTPRGALGIAAALLSLAGACSRERTPSAGRPAIPAPAKPLPERVLATSFPVQGMHCTGCEYSVESGLRLVSGVVAADADHERASVRVEFDPTEVTVERLVEAVNEIGYRAALPGAPGQGGVPGD